ncbi:MAG TPA: hypothetical protein VGE85_12855 [Terracidiphilus sp.]|jgi:hypothetical protein
MLHFRSFRLTLWALLGLLLAVASSGVAHTQKPLPLKPGQPATAVNHHLILKDGSYQIVRKYEIVGDRVRYISAERAGDWEELPVALVDWDATRKWEQDHAATIKEVSAAMEEAAEIDKEEAAERDELKARRPEVATDLTLPDEDAVFALDTFEGSPELVELVSVDMDINAKYRHGLSTLNPLSTAKASIELEGAHARVHLHVGSPVIYLSLAAPDAYTVHSHSLTVQTGNSKEVANRKHGAHSPTSGFAIVRADERNTVRIIGAIHVSHAGAVTQDENVIPAKVEELPGKHWLKITPQKPLDPGEYTLVEIISASEINQSVWDFSVDPQSGDNERSIGPIVK